MSLEKYKTRLFIFKEWKRNTDPTEVADKINATLDNKDKFMETVSNTDVEICYDLFNQNGTVFEEDSSMHLFAAQFGPSKSLTDPLLFMDKCKERNERKLLAKNGRFLIIPRFSYVHTPSKIIIYDLFNGTKRTNPVSFEISRKNFAFIGEYLLITEQSYYSMCCKLYLLKINYDDLSVEELNNVDTGVHFYHCEVLPDQLDDKKFVIYGDTFKAIAGQIQDGKIIMESTEYFKSEHLYGKRLIGTELQGFTDYSSHLPNSSNSLKFYELNLNTRKTKKTSALIAMCNDNVKDLYSNPCHSCWSHNTFYGFYEMESHLYQLLCFDVETFKWTDVQVLAQWPKGMFIDENGVLILLTGGRRNGGVFHRLALRKPDTLVALTSLCALRESNLYGNDKYIKVVQNLGI